MERQGKKFNHMENCFRNIAASTGKKSVIIHNRGLMDVKTYLPVALWEEILKRNNWTEQSFLDRYDIVVHLVTAADGPEGSTNNALQEGPFLSSFSIQTVSSKAFIYERAAEVAAASCLRATNAD